MGDVALARPRRARSRPTAGRPTDYYTSYSPRRQPLAHAGGPALSLNDTSNSVHTGRRQHPMRVVDARWVYSTKKRYVLTKPARVGCAEGRGYGGVHNYRLQSFSFRTLALDNG